MEEDGKPAETTPEYLIGKELEDEMAKNSSDSTVLDHVVYPIKEGQVVDWDAFEAILKHIVVKELGVRRAMNECPCLVAIPMYWGNDDVDRLCQIMFEMLNVPGLYVADAPLMGAFGCGVLSAVIIDIGHTVTSITPVVESLACRNAMITLPFGGADVTQHLKKLLNADQQLVKEYDGPVDDALAIALKESDLCELKITREMSTPAALASTKRVDFEFGGKKITIGPSRFKAHELIFQPEESGIACIGLAEAILTAVLSSTDVLEKRLLLWDNIIITGGASAVKGIRERLENELSVFLAASETSSEFQPKDLKHVRIPEYFSAYRDRQADAVFLGGTIVAKLTLHSGGQHITKADYNELGPPAIRLKQ
ncbi:hypothetical protein HDU67_009010 [Dinochytrium kinnereticum]|nr:hypothetical protein HDU67_009010 [Dinochytrium kinnereticum]